LDRGIPTILSTIGSPKKRFGGFLPDEEQLPGEAAGCLFSQRKVRIRFYRISIV
jgi:hypothetical protein